MWWCDQSVTITYSRDHNISPTAYVDADYGGCKDTRCSTSGYVFTMAGGAVSWSSKCQATVALSTVEAEYVAMSRCTQQMVWMNNWLDEVKVDHTLPGLIKGDNRGAIALTKNTGITVRWNTSISVIIIFENSWSLEKLFLNKYLRQKTLLISSLNLYLRIFTIDY